MTDLIALEGVVTWPLVALSVVVMVATLGGIWLGFRNNQPQTGGKQYALVVEGPADEAGQRGVEDVYGPFAQERVVETQEQIRSAQSGEGVTVTAVRLRQWPR